MKLRFSWLLILCLALAAVPAFATTYSNGPINGTVDGWTINFGYIVSDTFTIPDAGNLVQVSFGVWEFTGDTMQTVDYTISSTENGSGVGTTANVSDKFISTNQYGYNIDLITFNTGIPLNAGTYWLNLSNATVPSGDPVYWDENSGKGCQSNGCPSQAAQWGLLLGGSETETLGTIPSEAFSILTYCGSSPAGKCSLEPTGTTVEPGSILLFGSGIVGLAGVLRRRLNRA